MRMGLICLAAALVSVPGGAWAYSDATSFSRDPSAETSGGGGGFFFTGSPRQHGLDCSVCHEDASDGATSVRLAASKNGSVANLFLGQYEPGAVYQIEVTLEENLLSPGEACQANSDKPCDISSFAFEILDRDGNPAGSLCAEAFEGTGDGCDKCGSLRARGALIDAGCTVALGDAFDASSSGWRNGAGTTFFYWRAPAVDTGILKAYVSMVDGRGPESAEGEVTSFEHDGVVTASAEIASPTEAPSSCQAVGSDGSGVLLLVLLLVRRRR